MTDQVQQFRKTRVEELGAIVNECADESREVDHEVDNIISRMRELYFFAPDLVGMVDQLKDIALRNNLVYWAKHNDGRGLNDLPWARIGDAAESLGAEPRLFHRDWSQGPIQPQFTGAISGWVDLGDAARRARADSTHHHQIDDIELLVGAMTVFKYGVTETFKLLDSPAVDMIPEIFQTILERSDLELDMFPSALTYFGAEGLMVLNKLATENTDLYTTILRFADQGMFNPKGGESAPSEPLPPPPQQPTAFAEPARASQHTDSLAKGANVSLSAQTPHLGTVRVGLGWDARTTAGAAFDLDASALACGPDRRVITDQHFVFYNNPRSPEGTIVHTGDNTTGDGDGDDEVIEVNLAATADTITNIVFAVSIDDPNSDGLTFGQVHNAFIRVADSATGTELARFDLTEDAATETAMVFGELYRRGDEWKFRAIGQGYASGLAGIAQDYGVNIE